MGSHKDKKLLESIKDEFKASYYTIKRSGLRKREGHGLQQHIVKAKKNRDKRLVGPQSTAIAQQLVYLRKLDV